jgi:curli biogenesis system outer membrane secretion channel CsgG
MKRLVLVGIFAALFAAVVVIAATWSRVTPVNPAVSPDTAATPNPTAERK